MIKEQDLFVQFLQYGADGLRRCTVGHVMIGYSLFQDYVQSSAAFDSDGLPGVLTGSDGQLAACGGGVFDYGAGDGEGDRADRAVDTRVFRAAGSKSDRDRIKRGEGFLPLQMRGG